jgi:superoxide reductase
MEKSKEGAVKHIPKVTINEKCGLIPEESCIDVLVRVGETLHPMLDNHFIQFIDCYVDEKYVSRIFLTPAVNPSVVFHLKSKGSKVTVVENCNIHGYWKKDIA